ncbi:histone demethylase Jhd2p [Monosporozyma servazzii]
MSLEIVPELRPTLEELEDPIEYLSRPQVVRLGLRYGLLKLCPPAEFQYRSNIDKDTVSFTPRLQKLAELQLLNRARWFFIKQLYNFNDNISLNGNNSKRFPYIEVGTNANLYIYDLFINLLKDVNSIPNNKEASPNNDKFQTFHTFTNLMLPPSNQIKKDMKTWIRLSKLLNIDKDILLSVFNEYLNNYYDFLYHFNNKVKSHHLPVIAPNINPVSLLDENIYDYEDTKLTHNYDTAQLPPPDDIECHICHIENDSPLHECKTCNNWFHFNCFELAYLNINYSSIVPNHCHECVIGNATYGFTIDKNEFTIAQFAKLYKDLQTDVDDDIHSLENEFWDKVNNCMSKDVVKYGADIPYPESISHEKIGQQPMNLLNLPNNKRSLLRFCKDNSINNMFEDEPSQDDQISGMTLPWLYIGSKFSTFCWHMEDQYTLSANYQHEGAPKVWYSIPPQSCYDFGEALYQSTPDLFIKDQNLVHQLTCLVSPYDPIMKDLKIFKVVQYPGEFIITFPQCYHSGFNTGYNFNEAVNFTTNFWINFGVRAVSDYKFTRKKCVFDIYLLLKSILNEFLASNHKMTTNLGLYRDAFNVLLNEVNTEMKRISKLSEMGVKIINHSESNNQSGLLDNESFCHICHTTFTFAYCQFEHDTHVSIETVCLCLEHGLKQLSRTMATGRFTVNIKQDMDDVFQLLRQCGEKLDH